MVCGVGLPGEAGKFGRGEAIGEEGEEEEACPTIPVDRRMLLADEEATEDG